MNILDGIKGHFEVVRTEMAILGQEEGNNCSEFGLGAHGNPVESTNWDLISVCESDLIGWR